MSLPYKGPVPRDAKGHILPGYSGNPTGRPASPQQITRKDVLKICAERGYNPIHAMIDVAQDPKTSNYLKLECADKIAQYILPKLKNVQVTNAEGEDAVIRISWDTTPQQASQQAVDVLNNVVDAAIDDDTDSQ